MDTIAIKNTRDSVLGVAGFPAFQPGEVREVSELDAKILLSNPFIVTATTENSEAPKKAKDKKEGK